jgi:hypothetical protein
MGRVWHPPASPRATTRQPGAERHDACTGSVEGCPWAAAWSGCTCRRDATRASTYKITGDFTVPLRSLSEQTPDQESGARQAFVQSIRAWKRRGPRAYINRHINGYRWPLASSELDRKMRPDPGQSAVVARHRLRLRLRLRIIIRLGVRVLFPNRLVRTASGRC